MVVVWWWYRRCVDGGSLSTNHHARASDSGGRTPGSQRPRHPFPAQMAGVNPWPCACAHGQKNNSSGNTWIAYKTVRYSGLVEIKSKFQVRPAQERYSKIRAPPSQEILPKEPTLAQAMYPLSSEALPTKSRPRDPRSISTRKNVKFQEFASAPTGMSTTVKRTATAAPPPKKRFSALSQASVVAHNRARQT